ncbi:hypothetical protein F0357_17350 [Rhizobiales bacterium Sp-1]|uniref:Uncharacterized protein n=2 Tax=Segnochrobactrum spirostomi TaxID=2608987 RepID=A0A6A7Y9Q7_9HYPH|nr:hypothetical protein [Segnochrobactrum spirostomi]
MNEFIDLALIFDASTRRADLSLGEDGDLVLDPTAVTPMLMSIGLDRRARTDDPLPSGITELNQPASLSERRGWAGDALDAQRRRAGSRLWLLERAKKTEITLLAAEHYLTEALGWAGDELSEPAEIEVAWVGAEVLGFRAAVLGHEITLTRRVGG